jgi:hypothetical protein
MSWNGLDKLYSTYFGDDISIIFWRWYLFVYNTLVYNIQQCIINGQVSFSNKRYRYHLHHRSKKKPDIIILWNMEYSRNTLEYSRQYLWLREAIFSVYESLAADLLHCLTYLHSQLPVKHQYCMLSTLAINNNNFLIHLLKKTSFTAHGCSSIFDHGWDHWRSA